MFSVVIPLFNKRPYIQRALDSVYAQTTRAMEIIVVDDGSTDGGAAIAMQQVDPRVRVLRQVHRGVSAARNAGIAAASQQYVAFLDADDRWLPVFLERMQTAIDLFPTALLYASGFVTVAEGEVRRRIGIHASTSGSVQPVDYFAVCTGGHPLHMSTTVVPKTAAVAIGGFAEGVAFCEDHLFWAKLARAGQVVLSSEALAEYDVAVPGQAVQVWQTAYRQQVLDYHRYLANELRAGGRKINPSFVRHCRREFRVALLQRLYWGDFSSMKETWQELRLAGLPLDPATRACGWVAEHPLIQPPLGVATRVARGVRGLCRRR